MALIDSEQQAIRDALATWLDAPHLPNLVPLARRLGALPVYADMGAALLLGPTGDVISVSTDQAWDENAATSIETQSEWVLIARLEAARRHDSLGFLRPQRPAGATDCGECSTTGSVAFGELRLRCGQCYGLGWRHAG